jgi:indolepyruvate ferredoxin oxidoreductase beta subunit
MSQNKDSSNLIITGVGGQGNVLASQLIGQAFVSKGYFATIGETYGASQRGGPVMSHIRISKNKQRSPLIPRGKGDIVVAMEPVEALRVLVAYGNPGVVALVNTRPLYPIDVTTGDEPYPELDDIKKQIDKLTTSAYFIDATEKALQMGSPILGNMIMIGALLELKLLPLSLSEFCETLSRNLGDKRLDVNLKAIEEGRKAIQ